MSTLLDRQRFADQITSALAGSCQPDDSGVATGMRIVIHELLEGERPLADVAELSQRVLKWHQPEEQLSIKLTRIARDIRGFAESQLAS